VQHFAVEDAATPDRGDLSNLTQTEYDTWQAAVTDLARARIRRRQVLGGLVREYQRTA
jgi:hypothetical protein